MVDEVDVSVFADATRFDEERLLNTELGYRFSSADNRVSGSITLFNMDRGDQQVKGSLVIPRSDGSTSFTDFTDNAASGTNRGLEATLDWRVLIVPPIAYFIVRELGDMPYCFELNSFMKPNASFFPLATRL